MPLIAVLVLMLGRRWSSSAAGALGLALAIAIGWSHFGMTWAVLWVSQVRAFALSFYVLYIIWAALLLYNVVNATGGIELLQRWLTGRLGDSLVAALLFAWPLSGVLEGIAGFGVPLAVVSPMLVALGINPVTAVVATAVGHAWSVTFGDMGVVFEALVSIVGVPARQLAPAAAIVLGGACVASGFAVARVLGLRGVWARIGLVGLTMAGVQAILAIAGPSQLAALGAGVAGLAVGVLLLGKRASGQSVYFSGLAGRLSPYVVTAALLAIPAFVPSVAEELRSPRTAVTLPAVATNAGWTTAAGEAKVVDWLLHPGTVMLVSLAVTAAFMWRRGLLGREALVAAGRRTARTAVPTSLGVLSMIGLAMVMDHTGMTQTLARATGTALGRVYPLVAPFVGMLGAFTTGSNTSSNVLFGSLQVSMAERLGLTATWLLAAQTSGGALGSMIAPTKLVVGCSAVGIAGQEGAVLRRTAPYAALLGLLLGALVLWLA